MKKIIFIIIFLLGLIYLLWPGPFFIDDFTALPNSSKSDEPGDTVQYKNIAAYFSQMRRNDVTNYYLNEFSYLNFFGFRVPPIRLNHPPEEAFTYIRDQQPSTYLEHYVYPFRDSLFVNGFEPFDNNGKPYREGATTIQINGVFYESKATLRYYSSSFLLRIIVYILSWVGIFMLFKLSKKALIEA